MNAGNRGLKKMIEAKKNERANALKEVKRLAKSLALMVGCLRAR